MNDQSVDVDEQVLQRLAEAVLALRGERSQREFARILGVAQSTVQSWENGKNMPDLENLEKIARIRGQLPEEFVAYLFGRPIGESMPVREKVRSMNHQELSGLMIAIAEKLAEQ